MQRRKFLGSLGVGAIAAGAACRMLALQGGGGTPPTKQSICDAVQANLELLDCFTANVNCTAAYAAQTFVGGVMQAKGEIKFRLSMGTLGDAIWWNENGVNHLESGNRYVGRWDDPETTADWWIAAHIGVVDPRVVLNYILQDATVSAGVDPLGVQSTWKLTGAGFRVWVEKANPHRIVQYELDYEEGGIAYVGGFAAWGPVQDSTGEMFVSCWTEHYAGDGTLLLSWDYQLANARAGVTLDNSLFETTF